MARVEVRLEAIRKEGVYVELLLPVHDELLVEVDEDYAGAVDAVMGYEMDQVLNDEQTGECVCKVPVLSDGKVMNRWSKE